LYLDNLSYGNYNGIMGKFIFLKLLNKGGGEVSIEVIKTIREAEEKAETIKKQAAQQAKQIVANANEQAQQVVEEARKAADSTSSNVLKNAEFEGQQLYEDIVKKTGVECESILNKADKNMDTAVNIILERIVKTSGNS